VICVRGEGNIHALNENPELPNRSLSVHSDTLRLYLFPLVTSYHWLTPWILLVCMVHNALRVSICRPASAIAKRKSIIDRQGAIGRPLIGFVDLRHRHILVRGFKAGFNFLCIRRVWAQTSSVMSQWNLFESHDFTLNYL
jgi:hypothetical protein